MLPDNRCSTLKLRLCNFVCDCDHLYLDGTKNPTTYNKIFVVTCDSETFNVDLTKYTVIVKEIQKNTLISV